MSERGTSAESFDGENKKSSVGSSSLALYRKYRPNSLDEIVGQNQVTDILKAAAEKRDFAHAYLFTGQRGTGKTSIARILAHLINDTPYLSEDIDIIEIDAASRGSVDDARELRDKSFIAPIAASHKVYIIDEVHMLSTAAFNALLKIIEEPPKHIVFIMATTEIQKVPATILSRVQRFHLRPASVDVVANYLKDISSKENISIDDEAINLISERGGGSFRDSISLLDQLSGSGTSINRETVEEILGLAPESIINKIITAVVEHEPGKVIEYLDSLYREGVNANLITNQIIGSLIKEAVDKPKLYSLIDKLLEVNKSSSPNIKLTAVLSVSAIKTSSVATAAISSREESQLAVIIEKKIVEEARSNKIEAGKHSEPKIAKEPSVVLPLNPSVPNDIIWQDVLGEIKNLDQPTILATLKFATAEYEHGNLVLYFDKSFHRKKADTQKFRESLSKACSNLYGASPKITISDTTQRAVDSKDSLVAGVAAIMGGGDIVKET